MTTTSKADQVHAQLKAQIELGELTPGTPLSELSLVARTGASRTPVREALRRLAAEGLVDLAPRLGARVSRVSAQSVRDLFEFRQLLEPAAIRSATEAANRAAGGVVLAAESVTDLSRLGEETGIPFAEVRP